VRVFVSKYFFFFFKGGMVYPLFFRLCAETLREGGGGHVNGIVID